MRELRYTLLTQLVPAALFAIIFAFCFAVPVHAQQGSGQAFPYAEQPDCPYQAGEFADVNCSYPNGDVGTCSGNLNTGNLICENPDGSSTRYSSFAGEGLIGSGCEVRASSNGEWRNCGTTSVTESTISTPVLDEEGNVVDQEYENTGLGGFMELAAKCVFNGPVDCTFQLIGMAMVSIATFFLGVAGVLFNFVVVKLVFQFGSVLGNSPGLLLAWGMMRDVGNMVLLFGFIFIGIMTLLDVQTYAVKKTLPKLIIFAILMNFSLFAAQAVIDVSNVFAASMYNQAGPCSTVSGLTEAQSGNYDFNADNCAINSGLAGSIMEASGLSTLFEARNNSFNDFYIFIGIALLALIGAFVMFAAAFMLVSRAVVLTFLMITAPLAFAGFAIPPLEKTAWSWWKLLLNNAFFAPLLILLILLSIKVMEGFGTVGDGGLAGALSAPNSTAMGAFLVFALVIGFLLASIIVAKKMGAFGADFAVKTGGKFAFGGAAWVGRNTAGRASAGTARALRETRFGKTEMGRRTITQLDRGGSASFDFRGSKRIRGAAKLGGLDIGQPTKVDSGGITGIRKDRDERRRKYAASLKPTEEQEEEKKNLEEEQKQLNEEGEKAPEKKRLTLKELDERLKAQTEAHQQELDSIKAEIAEAEKNAAGADSRMNDLEQRIEEARTSAKQLQREGKIAEARAVRQEQQSLQEQLNQISEQEREGQQQLDELYQRRQEKEAEVARIRSDIDTERAEAETAHANENAARTARLAQIKGELGGDRLNPANEYATNLETGMGFGRRERKATAKAIRKKMKSSSKDKAVDALKAALDDAEKNSKKEDDGGESK